MIWERAQIGYRGSLIIYVVEQRRWIWVVVRLMMSEELVVGKMIWL